MGCNGIGRFKGRFRRNRDILNNLQYSFTSKGEPMYSKRVNMDKVVSNATKIPLKDNAVRTFS